MIRKLITTIKGIIKVARMVSSDDSGAFQQGLFYYQGRTVKGSVLKQYGLLSKAPDNSMALLMSQNGQESNVIAMVDDPNNRTLKDLATGEVALTNYQALQHLHLKENGDAELKADRVIILVGGTTITIDDGQITVDNANTTLNGNLQVNGTIGATDTITSDVEVIADGVELTTHTHGAGSLVTPAGSPSGSSAAPD